MRRLALTFLLALLLPGAGLAQGKYAQRPEVRAFVRDLVERHGFVERELTALFSRVRRNEVALRAIQPSSAKARSWEEYRALFVNDRRVEAGLEFWRAHHADLARARAEFGVPESIVVAIIGVETYYGRNKGNWRVIDSLTTLAFDYPPRADFFRGELENYLLLAREQELDVFSVRGSYAGAIGIPQFMPGSTLRYAVDFDGDGGIDLRSSAVDAIGSVANFLRRHGWQPGEAIGLAAQPTPEAAKAFSDGAVLPVHSLEALRRGGVGMETRGIPDSARGALIELETPGEASEYRVGLQNFYVLTRYNRSAFYASAVWDLADALDQDAGRPGGR